MEVNATQMLKSSQELAPIAGLLPKEVKQRKKWVIEFYVKANSNWDCSWDKEVCSVCWAIRRELRCCRGAFS